MRKGKLERAAPNALLEMPRALNLRLFNLSISGALRRYLVLVTRSAIDANWSP